MGLETILSSLTNPNALSALSSATGSGTSDITSVLSSALPSLLGALSTNSQDSKDSASLEKALADHSKNDLSDVLGNLDLDDGAKIIGHLLGGNTDNVTKVASKNTGISSGSVATILSAVAPILMNIMGKETNSSNAKASGLDLGSIVGGLLGGGSSNENSNSGVLDLGDIGDLVGNLLGGSSDTASKKTTKNSSAKSGTKKTSTKSGTKKSSAKSGTKTSSKKASAAKKDDGIDLGDVASLLGNILK